MGKDILSKIRRLNWVLSESTTGNLSYEDLSRILSEIIDANVYILDRTGTVIGVAYNKEADSSTYENEHGVERVPEQDNEMFLAATETTPNLIGEALVQLLGADYEHKEKYHTIIPVVCGGERLGTLLLARYIDSFGDEDLALCEYGATVVGLEIRRNQQIEHARERSMRLAVDMAIETLSFSERDALDKILKSLEGDEGLIVTSKVASQYGLTNSVVVNALRKMSSAGLLESRSLGMKGTHIRIINPFLKETVVK